MADYDRPFWGTKTDFVPKLTNTSFYGRLQLLRFKRSADLRTVCTQKRYGKKEKILIRAKFSKEALEQQGLRRNREQKITVIKGRCSRSKIIKFQAQLEILIS